MKIALFVPGIAWLFRKAFVIRNAGLEREVFGLKFTNPVGLAAGFDKDGKFLKELGYLGFGFLEIGTVTPRPQEGNPKPRLFRLPASKGLINRMGFNNEGVIKLSGRLRNYKRGKILIGGNIGKNKVTPNAEAVLDYILCFEELFPLVDYFVINVSSPNTPGLRELQEKEPLKELIQQLQEKNHEQSAPKPLLLKIAPDLNEDQLDDILEIAAATRLDGIIATNTTIERGGLLESAEMIQSIGSGGLSGAPVRDRSTAVIRYLSEKSGGKLPIIGVGGICTPEDALEKLEAGAVLVQVYSGMVYSGPGLIKAINKRVLGLGG